MEHSPSQPLVSVIVPVRDNPAGIIDLLDCLAQQTLPAERFEIVIGDDGSQPPLQSVIDAALANRVRIVHGPPRTSYAARNRAAIVARGSILAFCDSDCLPQPNWLEAGMAALEHADVVAGEVRFFAPARPTIWSLLTIDMFLDQERNVQFARAVTANLIVSRQRFIAVGGFDESLPSGGDYDFVQRCVEHGARLVYAPNAIVHHPTLEDRRAFLRKVWTTNRWSAVRRARAGLLPESTGLVSFVPIVGVILARRKALRPVSHLYRPRLRAAGITPSWRHDLRTLPALYFLVSYVAGFSRVLGWREGLRLAAQGAKPSLAFAPPEAPQNQPLQGGMLR